MNIANLKLPLNLEGAVLVDAIEVRVRLYGNVRNFLNVLDKAVLEAEAKLNHEDKVYILVTVEK